MKFSTLSWFLNGAAAAVILSLTSTAQGENLVPDPEFKEVDFESPHYQRYVEEGFKWIFHAVETPAEATKEEGAVKLKGGMAFLHSSRFDVEPGQDYTASVKAAGRGEVRLDFLWFGSEVEERRSIALETTKVNDSDPVELSGSATAPEGAREAYLRIAVSKGTVTVSSPSVE